MSVPSRLARALALVASIVAGCAGAGAAGHAEQASSPQNAAPAATAQALDPALPAPKSIIGHDVGERPVRYDDLVRYMKALDEASPLVTLTPYGITHEGRSLYYLTITSAANHAKLAQIKADNAKLADPRKTIDAEANRIIETLPAIAWLAYCIHGDEISPSDSALQVMYALAAGTDDATKRLRDELVIHIDPMQNPDGRERYLANLQTFWGKVPNDDYQSMQHGALWAAGRTNHYLFDLNRDWLPLVHLETQGRVQALGEWNPHFQVDSHEMGALDTYLFDPPREPINPHYSANNLKWRRQFAHDQAGAFNQRGWSYYTREWLDDWYPGYTNAWANLTGAISLLYEQAGASGASVMQPHGKAHTYKTAIEQNVVSTVANLETLRANREAILADFYADARANVSDAAGGSRTFLLAPPADRARHAHLMDVLRQHRIEFSFANEAFTARTVTGMWGATEDSREFPAGTLIIRPNQPRRRLLLTILGFDPRMTDEFLVEERRDIEQDKGTRSYDITAWNLAMAYGLQSYWATDVPAVNTVESLDARVAGQPRQAASAPYGFLIDVADSDAMRAAARLLQADVRVRAALEPFTLNGQRYERGTMLVRRVENADDIVEMLTSAFAGLPLHPVFAETALVEDGPDLGGQKFPLLARPRIAIASQWPVSANSFGATWFLIDERLRLPCSPINIQDLGGIDLRRYNILILPDGGRYSAVLGESAREAIKAWVESGGTLIAFGNAAAFLANKERELSDVRLRPDVLTELDVYAEAVERERAARKITVDSKTVWEGETAPAPAEADDAEGKDTDDSGDNDADKEKDGDGDSKSNPEGEKLKRWDKWAERFSPQGAILLVELNPDHFLSYGLGKRLPVMFTGSDVFLSKPPAQTAARLAPAHELRLSGLLWPEARQRIADSAYATRESLGDGQVILFAGDPFFRGFFEGSGRMLQNAIILGPGLGTNQPVPWE